MRCFNCGNQATGEILIATDVANSYTKRTARADHQIADVIKSMNRCGNKEKRL